MSAAEFSQERSAAIRQLLIDTVDAEPRRRRRLQIVITSALAAVAVALAGGTAALALSGVIHLGGGDDRPAPMPTPTQTPTPTPTPPTTPTAAPPRQIAVQTSPIFNRDVMSVPARPSWSIDLPGSGDPCEQQSAYDIADGLALLQTGAVAVGDRDDCHPEDQKVTLSLVDTGAGAVLWTREWHWTWMPGSPGMGWGTRVQTVVLGTSGNVLVDDVERTGGPHEVLRLSDGTTLGSFDPPGTDVFDTVAVPDDSGDVLIQTPGDFKAVQRVDPLDASHPQWTSRLTGQSFGLTPDPLIPNRMQVVAWSDNGSGYGDLDLADGSWLPAPSTTTVHAGGVEAYVEGTLDGGTALTAYDPKDGTRLWSRTLPAEANVSQVGEAAGQPGQAAGVQADSGYLAVAAPTAVTLIEARTGAAVSANDPSWVAGVLSGGGRTRFTLDPAHDMLLVAGESTLCRMDAHTGAALPGVEFPPIRAGIGVYGANTFYPTGYWDAAGTGSAYDLHTGEKLWSTPVKADERWYFLGGVLVRQVGNHVESVG